MSLHNRLTYLFSLIFVGLAIYFLIIFVLDLDLIALRNSEFDVKFIVLSAGIGLLVRFIYPYAWILLIRQYSEPVNDYLQLNYVFSKAWLARYMPGKVAWLAGKIYFASLHGISKTTLTVITGFEIGIQLASALLLAFIFLGVSGEFSKIDPVHSKFAFIALLSLMAILVPRVFNTITRIITNVLSLNYSKYKKIDLSTFFRYFIIFCFVHIAGGLSFFLIAQSVGADLVLFDYFYYTAISLLAGVIGTLAVFVPSGLGIREGVLILLLQGQLPSEMIIVLVLTTRLLSITTDVLFFAICKLLVFIRPPNIDMHLDAKKSPANR